MAILAIDRLAAILAATGPIELAGLALEATDFGFALFPFSLPSLGQRNRRWYQVEHLKLEAFSHS